MKKFLSAAACFCLTIFTLNAQDASQQNTSANSPVWGNKKIITLGGAQINYVHTDTTSGFRDAKFSLMTLAEISRKLFLVSELEVETGDGFTDIGLEQLQLCYSLTPWMTVYGGRFLPKFGHYRGMLGEGFLNRTATDPVGFGDGGIGPMVETGLGAVGGFQLGYTRLNYDVYVSNGPQLLTGSSDDPTTAGQFEYESYLDNNKNKAIGGRIGFLPLPNSSLEIGLSGQYSAKTADYKTHLDSVGVPATFSAVDLSYYHSLDFIKSMFRLIGEYKTSSIGKVDYQSFADTAVSAYSFNNNSSAWYVQASLRPLKTNIDFVNNLELAVRYSDFIPPAGSLWFGGAGDTKEINQTAVSLNYWLSWDCVLKLTYRQQSNQGTSYIAQLVYRF